jgi:hypothetical protein
MERGKTIQIYLPDGNPRSIKIAEISTSITKAIFIPRSKINEVSNRPELQGVGIYFLFGEENELDQPKVYVGEAETLITRIKQHNASKDFWNVAVVFISEKNNLNKAHVKFLENFCCNKAKEINRCELENSVNPTKSSITESDEDFVLSFYDDLKVLLTTLGFPIFEELKRHKKDKTYFCKGKGAIAEGEYTEEGLVVFKGSKANLVETSSAGQWVNSMRTKLKEKGILVQKDNLLEFTDDYVFNSPSAAAAVILARRANGWTEWKNKESKTLDEVERKENV